VVVDDIISEFFSSLSLKNEEVFCSSDLSHGILFEFSK